MISLLENPDIWLISGIVLMIIEVFFGSLVIFLPVGMASLIVGLIYKFQNNFELNIIENWAYALVLWGCLLYTSPSPRDRTRSRMPSSA